MATLVKSKADLQGAMAQQFLISTIEQSESAAAVSRLNDIELRKKLREAIIASGMTRTDLQKALRGVSATMARMARMVGRLTDSPTPSIGPTGAWKRVHQTRPGESERNELVRRVRAKHIEEGSVLLSSAIRGALGISRQALNKARKANRIFSMELAGDDYYPAFFADPELDRRQVEQVAKQLGDLPGWEKWQFFTTPKGSLGGATPIEALKNGLVLEVRKSAINFAQR